MVAEIRTTEVNLDGLLQVLGENLYSTPKMPRQAQAFNRF